MSAINKTYDIKGATVSSIKPEGIKHKKVKKASAESTAPEGITTAPEASTQSEPPATEESASPSPPQ